jgi:hypothetical protein
MGVVPLLFSQPLPRNSSTRYNILCCVKKKPRFSLLFGDVMCECVKLSEFAFFSVAFSKTLSVTGPYNVGW